MGEVGRLPILAVAAQLDFRNLVPGGIIGARWKLAQVLDPADSAYKNEYGVVGARLNTVRDEGALQFET